MGTEQTFTPGTVLLGKYRIDRQLGQGGMAVVAQATHLQLQERVAIKCLLPEIVGNREVVQRFLREAQAAVKLKGEHVARMIDVGTLETGEPYIVMEYLEGADLSQVLTDRGRLPPAEAVNFLLQACEAMAEAHAMGIVHRDIKPANFYITRRPDGTPLLKVLDFGISKAPVEIDQGLTRTNSVMGTPAYMSPEQMRSARDVDGRTDIWALGVVLHETLSGVRPWPAETFSELCMKVATDPPDPLPPDVPDGLRRAVERCLIKQPEGRFANCADLAIALAPFASNPHRAQMSVERIARMLGVAPRAAMPMPATVMAPAGNPTTLSSGTGQAITAPPAMPSRRGPGLIIGAVIAAAAAVALVIVFTRGGGHTGQPAAGPVPADAAPKIATPAPPVAPAAETIDAAAPPSVAATPPDAGPTATPAKPAVATHKHHSHRTKKPLKKPERPPYIDQPPSDDDILGSRH